jgi:hypothetical protein
MNKILETRRLSLIAALVLVFVIGHFAGVAVFPREGHLLRGDSRKYYAYLPSIVIDHDLDFRNDYAQMAGGLSEEGEPLELNYTATGLVANAASIGPAIFWAPFFLVALVLQALGSALLGTGGAWNGYGALPQASALIAGIFYAGAATWVTARILDRWFSRAIATGSAICIWLAGSALYYTAVSPAYSHSTAWFVVTVALMFWMEARALPPSARPWWLYATSGLAFGLAVAVRQQDALFLIIPAIDLAWPSSAGPPAGDDGPGDADRRNERAEDRRVAGDDDQAAIHGMSWAGRFTAGVAFGAGVLLGFLPQSLTWKVVYGFFVGTPQDSLGINWLAPDFVATLFSLGFIGLFTWTPIVAAGAAGLIMFTRRHPPLGTGMIVALILSVYYQSAAYALHLGTSFGARRFISANVLFAVGIACVWTWLAAKKPRLAMVLAALAIVWNGIVLIAYEVLVHVHHFHPPLQSILLFLFTGYSESPY